MTEHIDFTALPKVVAIVGSRSFADNDKTDQAMYKKMKKFVGKLQKGTLVVSGGARGIDTYAADCARIRKTLPNPDVKWPDKNLPVPERFFSRNRQIVDRLLIDGGAVIAFIDVTDCDGTMYTVRYAKKVGVPVILMKFSHAGNFKEVESTESEYLTDVYSDSQEATTTKLED